MKFLILVVWAASLEMSNLYVPVETRQDCVNWAKGIKQNSPKAIVSAECFIVKKVK